MPFSNTGVYTATTGATTAAAGDTIKSTTWDAINTDYVAGLTQLAQGKFGLVVGGYAVSISVSVTGDTQITIPVSIIPAYVVDKISVFASAGSAPNAATRIGLFTGAAGTGTQLIASTNAVGGITTVGVSTSSNMQTLAVTASTVIGAGTLFVNVAAAGATASVCNFYIFIRPAPTT